MTNKKTSSTAKRAKAATTVTPGNPLEVALVEAARILEVDRGTLENWRAEGCPGIPPEEFRPDLVQEWAEKNGKRALERTPLRAQKTIEEIRKLRLANDQKEGRLVDRAWVAERIQRAAGDLNAFRSKSEAEHPMRFAAAAGDVPMCRTTIRGIWDEIFGNMQSLKKHFAE